MKYYCKTELKIGDLQSALKMMEFELRVSVFRLPTNINT